MRQRVGAMARTGLRMVPTFPSAPENMVGFTNLAIALADPQLANAPERLGWSTRSFVLVTKSLLLVIQQQYQDNSRLAPFSPRRRIWDLNNPEPRRGGHGAQGGSPCHQSGTSALSHTTTASAPGSG